MSVKSNQGRSGRITQERAGPWAAEESEAATLETPVRPKEAELQLLADTTPLILVRCGRDLNYKFINKAGAALFGLTPAEIVGKSIIDVMGKRPFATVQPYVRMVLRGESVAFEAEIPYPAAGLRWMRVNYEPERDQRGKVTGWLASIVDITEIKAAQEARREYEERFARFMGNLPGLAWIKDLDGRYVYVNDSAVEAFGIPREQLYGRFDDEIFSPEVATQFKENDRLALERSEAIERVETLTQPDGLHYSIVTKFPIVGPEGETAGVGGMAIDITERVLAEEQLRRSQERFLLAQRAGGVGIWDWDILSGRTYWSETTWAFYGETPSSLNPDEAFWSEHIHEEDRERVMRRLQEALDSGGDRYWDEFRIARPDGSVLWIETSATITRDAREKPTRVYGVNLDITRRREGEEELRRAHDELELRVVDRTKELAEANALLLEQMEEQARAEEQRIRLLKKIVTIQEDERGRIARDLHDQLGQRLTALRLKIAALRDVSPGDELVSQRIARLQEISEGIDNEVSYLAWELRPSILQDAGLVAALQQHVKEWSRHSGIPGEFSSFGLRDHVIPPDLETNLYRIAQEALNNAAKHSRASRANVLLERRGHELILIIEDDGVGFDPNAGSRGDGSGRGFGLASMRDRVGVIGGALEIESEPKKGTAIFVRVSVE